MLRVVLVNFLLFLLPFAIYAVFLLLTRPKGAKSDLWREMPLLGLFCAGTALVVAVMVFFVSFSGAPREGTYKPAEFRDGKLVPGRVDRE